MQVFHHIIILGLDHTNFEYGVSRAVSTFIEIGEKGYQI